MFLVVFSLNVHALPTDRTLPTMYKITGDVNITSPSNRYFFLLAYVTSNGSNYPIGKSTCVLYDTFKDNLAQGIFVGPIASDLVGYTSKSIDMKLSVISNANLTQCTNNYNAVVVDGGTTYGSD